MVQLPKLSRSKHVTSANVVGPDIIVKGEGPGLHRHPHDHEEIILDVSWLMLALPIKNGDFPWLC